MLSLLLRRAGFSLLSLLLVSACLFALTRAIPDSPARIVLGQDATQEQVDLFEHDHGLDLPALVQYLRWIGGIVRHGDLGQSFVTGRPAGQDVARTLPVTLELVTLGFIFACVAALAAGIASALMRGTIVDHGVRLLAVLGVSMPGFWLALLHWSCRSFRWACST
jgi:peptide/nickel transport system permease protein